MSEDLSTCGSEPLDEQQSTQSPHCDNSGRCEQAEVVEEEEPRAFRQQRLRQRRRRLTSRVTFDEASIEALKRWREETHDSDEVAADSQLVDAVAPFETYL